MASSASFAGKLLFLTVAFASMGIVWKVWPEYSYIKPQLNYTYDYVIVGGGTAGSVLADRLSEDGTASVAVLEAGDEDTSIPMLDIPLAAGEILKTKADWNYLTVPQNNSCLGLNDKKSYWPRGKIIGGSSSISWMSYIRGNRQDYNYWESAGCEGWSFDAVKPYFLKSENNRNGKFVKSGEHGKEGSLTVADSFASEKLTKAFLQAARGLGYKTVDVNGQNQMGVMHNQYMANWGRRVSAAKAFLRPALKRPNLHVATNAHAVKILFSGKTAVGIQYMRNGTLRQVRARREVIVAAGTIASPHLLMLSGIGPQNHLAKYKIPVIADLPVGNNLQDHLWTDALTYTLEEHCSVTAKKAKGMLSMLEFIALGTGYLSSTGIEGTGFFRAQDQPDDDKRPYLQLSLFIMLPAKKKKVPTATLR